MLLRLAFAVVVAGCYSSSPAPVVNQAGPAEVAGVTPKVRITTAHPDEGDGGQALEGFPPFAYDHLPAVSVDGRKVAVVEERDGWGHTPTPGVRILDARSGETLVWLPVVSGEGWVPDEARAKQLSMIEELVAQANTELARTKWLALAEPTEPTSAMEGGDRLLAWTVGDHKVTARLVAWDGEDDPNVPAPNAIVVQHTSGREVLKLDGLARRWAHNPRCSSPSFKLAGSHAASRTIVFHQKLGRTTHACDGVPVPDDWRIVRF